RHELVGPGQGPLLPLAGNPVRLRAVTGYLLQGTGDTGRPTKGVDHGRRGDGFLQHHDEIVATPLVEADVALAHEQLGPLQRPVTGDVQAVFAVAIPDVHHDVVVAEGQRLHAPLTHFDTQIAGTPVDGGKFAIPHVDLNVAGVADGIVGLSSGRLGLALFFGGNEGLVVVGDGAAGTTLAVTPAHLGQIDIPFGHAAAHQLGVRHRLAGFVEGQHHLVAGHLAGPDIIVTTGVLATSQIDRHLAAAGRYLGVDPLVFQCLDEAARKPCLLVVAHQGATHQADVARLARHTRLLQALAEPAQTPGQLIGTVATESAVVLLVTVTTVTHHLPAHIASQLS